MELVISLRPNSSQKTCHSICNEKMKQIYNLKFHSNKTNTNTQYNTNTQDIFDTQDKDTTYFSRTSDIILDCKYGKEIFNMTQFDDYIPIEWTKYSLHDFVNVKPFCPRETTMNKITALDVEDFYASIDSHLYYEEENYVTEDEQ